MKLNEPHEKIETCRFYFALLLREREQNKKDKIAQETCSFSSYFHSFFLF